MTRSAWLMASGMLAGMALGVAHVKLELHGVTSALASFATVFCVGCVRLWADGAFDRDGDK